jgi:hypothetical protein
MDQLQASVVENELKRIQTGVFDAWRLYMTWYTWFFGANLVVLGWIFTRGTAPLEPRNVAILAVAWILFNITGVVSTWRLRSLTMQATKQAAKLGALLATLVPESSDLNSNLGFPADLGNAGALANALSLTINICLWFYLCINSI